MPKTEDMTEKQKRFVEEYLIDLNATQAAIRAEYSAKTADKIGSGLLRKSRVRDAIARAMAERSRRTGINQDRVLREIARVAFVNPDAVIDFEDGTLKPDVSPDDLACVAGIKVKTSSFGEDGKSVEREIKLNDKIKALDMLCKHLGLYEGDGKKPFGARPGEDRDTGVILMPDVAQAEFPPEGGEGDGKET